MKKEFIGFYNPTDEEISNSWKNGKFAFDANTLLNLYRYTAQTRKDFIRALHTIQDKLFLPHQAAFEFHSNRLGVIEGIENSYSTIDEIFKENFEKIEPLLNQFKKHPSILIDKIFKLYKELQKKVTEELNQFKKNQPDFESEDDDLRDKDGLLDERMDICVKMKPENYPKL